MFTKNLDENIANMQALFKGDGTFITRLTQSPSGLRCAVFFLDGMVNSLAINQSIICPLVSATISSASAESLSQTIIQINDSRVEPDIDKLLAAFLYGDTIILTEGESRAVVVNTKGFAMRSIAEPEGEKVLRGPREGFTECFMPNLAQIRRRLNDPRLKLTFSRIGERTNTVVCLCYLNGVADKALVHDISKRLSRLKTDSILDANYIAERIRENRHTPFPTFGTTERPDVVAARLLEGRIAILVDGSPVALTAPCILQECFQANDDYYVSIEQAGISRLLRYGAFFCTILVPAIYIAVLSYNQELLPTRLLLAISASQQGVPLPGTWEIILLLIVFELLKEAGTRTPGVIGQTMSIVGGLVLGQAAVTARFISAPAVILVAIAGVTGLSLPKLQGSLLVIRLYLAICAAIFGLDGIMLGLSLLLVHLCSINSFGTPYMLNLLPRVRAHTEDGLMRAPWNKMYFDRFLVRKRDQ